MGTDNSSEERGADVRFPPPLVFLIAIAIGYLLHRFVMPLHAGSSTSIRVFGGAVIFAGLALMVSAARLFRMTGQDPVPWKPSPSLVAQGPYRYTRNPMYVGMTLIQIGIGLAANDLWIALLAVVALDCVHFIAVLPEETYLTSRFGSHYQNYRASVRRYL